MDVVGREPGSPDSLEHRVRRESVVARVAVALLELGAGQPCDRAEELVEALLHGKRELALGQVGPGRVQVVQLAENGTDVHSRS